MEKQENRDERWMAYLLGDLNAADAAAVEAEMKAEPEEALAFRNSLGLVRGWSSESVAHVPVDMDGLGIERSIDHSEEISVTEPRSRVSSVRGWPGLLVAASVLLLALTQVQFSFSIEDSMFSWGMDERPGGIEDSVRAEAEVAATSLISRIEGLEQAASELNSAVEDLALQNSLMAEWFNENTMELARHQWLESQTRVRDMQRMMSWTAYPEAGDVRLITNSGAATHTGF